jgi:hypothetical protein
VHELKGGETARGNALGTLAACAKHTLILTGTLLGGYADDARHGLCLEMDESTLLDYVRYQLNAEPKPTPQTVNHLHANFPRARRLSQLHRDPHLLGWFGCLCDQNPPYLFTA